jgi:hydroxymethylbilane synthase
MRKPIVIGTRGSDLALWQASNVKERLGSFFPELSFELKIISTTGDRLADVALSKIGDKGLFTRQIENELLGGSIDLAVHSLKDLQTEQPAGLTIGAVCERELPNDALIASGASSLAELPQGARVATGSLRRRSQLLNYRPDLNVEDIRGNVSTRLRKFDEAALDGMVLAYAGLHRLGLDRRITEMLPVDIMIPAVGQGAVAVEIRYADERIAPVVARIDHLETRYCAIAERAFLRRLQGGCQVPIAGLATIIEGRINLTGMVGTLDGSIVLRETASGEPAEAERLGNRLAEALIERGAAELLTQARVEAQRTSEAVL